MNTQLMPVAFHGDTVVLVGKDGEPYVAMKPVVANMGLDWKSQHAKLGEKFGSVMAEITTTGVDGKQYGMTCLPLRKLAAWLYSISPNKVAPELRDKVVQYQEECDEVLWNYWSKGVATRPGAVTIAQQISMSKHRFALMKELMRSRNKVMREALEDEITRLSGSMGLEVPDLAGLGSVEPPQADVVTEFWAAIQQLDAKRVAYNHSKRPNLVALNMPHLAELFAQHGIPIVLGPGVTTALKSSVNPRFIDLKAVDSVIRKVTVKCWLFAQPDLIKAE